jgi:D-threonate/D-erythronate kinase
MSQWLVLADDLTGACDASAPFAARGLRCEVAWTSDTASKLANIDVLAVDLETRGLSAEAAASRTIRFLDNADLGSRRLLKKIDSTLRGHPAIEIAAVHSQLSRTGIPALGIFAPAFPATGRTTVNAQVLLDGQPLESSSLWQRERGHASANLIDLLASANIRASHLPLSTVRNAQALSSALEKAASGECAVVVCDAVGQQDLDHIARAGLTLAHAFFIGSAGLAHALAAQIDGTNPGMVSARATRPVLTIIGSRHEASRAAVAAYARAEEIFELPVPAKMLRDDLPLPHLEQATNALNAGQDVLVHIMSGESAAGANETDLAARLATLSIPLMPYARSLILSGGDTASAVLARCGVRSLRLVDELEPGICLSEARGERIFNVVTKAGAFGDAQCLRRIAERLHSLDRADRTP